jgi:signal transduction histidine kinase
METHFASPERAGKDELQQEIEAVSQNPMIDSLLKTMSGLIAVLNEHRQILALNLSFLKIRGVDDEEAALGLRPGEFVQCVHSRETEGGCGTSEFCVTCGAAIAMVSSLETDGPAEEKCVLTIQKEGKKEDLFLKVRSAPIHIDGRRLLLLFLNDITKEQQAANIERLFFHDINNIVFAIQGRAELLSIDNEDDQFSLDIFNLSQRLAKEIEIQRSLSQNNRNSYTPVYRPFLIKTLMEDIQNIFANHPAAASKRLSWEQYSVDLSIQTDYSLLMRILVNMVTNALEASAAGDQIRLSVKAASPSITFTVWSPAPIPDAIQKRIFQRNFSTKSDIGRGLGTYAMKFFGESILKGRVGFNSSPETGTSFWISLPL